MKALLFLTLMVGCFKLSRGVKILTFSDSRSEGTGARLLNGRSGTTQDLSLCIDFMIFRVKNSRVLVTDTDQFGYDLEIYISDTLDRFYITVKGIYYLTAPVDWITPYEFGTLCFSYDTTTHKLAFAYQGQIMLNKTDPILQADSQFSQNFLQKIVLGMKSSDATFSGAITRLNIWSSPMSMERLESESGCNGESSVMGTPDLLAWETSRWNAIKEKEAEEYPCQQSDGSHLIEVVMPYESEGVEEAHSVCGRLGGTLRPPTSEEDMQRLVKITLDDVDNSDCSSYLWLPFAVNQDDKWAVHDGSAESMEGDNYVEPKWLGWARGQPNGLGMETELEMCAAVGLKEGPPQLYDVDCEVVGYCYTCAFEVNPFNTEFIIILKLF